MAPFRFIITPYYRQAELFRKSMGWDAWQCRVAVTRKDMYGYDLSTWDVWWLDRQWPCRTHEDITRMEEIMAYARLRGADIRRWYT